MNTFKKIVGAYELGDTEVQSSVDAKLELYTTKAELIDAAQIEIGSVSTSINKSVAIGGSAYANGSAIAIGTNATSSNYALSVGESATAGNRSISIGLEATSVALGISIGGGSYSMANSVSPGRSATSVTLERRCARRLFECF